MNQDKIMHYQVEQQRTWSYYMRRVRSMKEVQTERGLRLASQSAVVIFSISSCCMCHAMKRLYCGMEAHELDHDPKGKEMKRALMRLLENSTIVPVVLIGGEHVASMDRVLAFHINGSLFPLLKQSGALSL